MEEINMKVDDLESKNSATVKGSFRCATLSLTIVPKKLCAYCKNSNIVNLEVKANIQHKCDLKADMEKALFNENFSDFSFIVDKEKIPVCKTILAARSPVFVSSLLDV